MDTEEKQKMIADLINDGEKDIAVRHLSDWSNETSFKDVMFNVLESMLVKWGKLWMQGKLSLAYGYLSGKVAEELLTHSIRRL